MKCTQFLLLGIFLLAGLSLKAQHQVQLTKQYDKATEVQLLEEGKSSNTIKVQLNAFSREFVRTPKGKAAVIQAPDATSLLKRGYPDLPKISRSFIIPDEKKMQVQVVASSYKEFSNVEVAPSKGNITRDQDPDEVPYTYANVYEKNSFYPQEIASLQKPYILRDFRGQALWIKPFQYNPVEKTLRVYTELELKLSETKGKPENALQRRAAPDAINTTYESLYRRHFMNYPLQGKYTPLEEGGNMLIIADAEYMDAMQDFINWKQQKGMPVEMKDVEEIGRSASEIEAFVEDYYNTQGLTYLLLVGDGGTGSGEIPSLDVSGHSDNAYGYILGDDSYPEVFVGRFSAETAEDVETQVQRVLHYERDMDTDASWLAEATGIASEEGGSGQGDDDEIDYEHIRNIEPDLLGFTYTATNEFFEGSQGEEDADGDPTPSMVAEALNDGSGLINYVGHGSSTSWGTSGFAVSDINELTNEQKLPFIFDVACVNGNFHGQTCFAESWMRATHSSSNAPTGAAAIIASTINQSWAPPMEAQDEMNDILTQQYSENIKHTFGGVTMNGCMQMNDEYGADGDEMTDTWTIFGDPSLMLRTEAPTPMTVSHNEALLIGQNAFTVSSNTEGAKVSLSYNNEIMGTATVENGMAEVTFEPLTNPGMMTVTVTAFNKVTYQEEVEVTPADQPYVILDSLALVDAAGNMNGEADYGESVALDAKLANVSDAYNAIGVVDTLITTSPFISLTDSVETYGDIAAEADSLRAGAFAFEVSDTVPDQYVAEFSMHVAGQDTVNDTSYVWPSGFNVVLNAPKPEIGQIAVLDTASGNGDGILDPGETADLKVEISNAGHAGAAAVWGALSTASNHLTLNSMVDTVHDFAEETTLMLTFNVTASGSTPVGTPADVELTAELTGNAYYGASATRQLIIGEIPEYLISEEGTVSACVGLFYDSGGPESAYSADESYTMTFEPGSSSKVIKADFLSFEVESGYDWLKIYNGASTSAPLLDTYDTDNAPGTLIADNASGALTFEFYADGMVQKAGWEAEISCVQMNEITFLVQDGNGPLEGAEVTFAGNTLTTGSEGTASFLVENDTYAYTIAKTGYEEQTGTMEVTCTETKEITMKVLRYNMTFNLYEEDGSTPIEGEITFNGTTESTNGGTYTFSDVAYAMNKKYTASVSDTYYTDYTDSVDVNQDRTLNITMPAKLYEVTITALDTAGVGIANSKVHINDTVHSADAGGHATMMLPRRDYSFTVSHVGYSNASGNISVDGTTTEYAATAELTIQSYEIAFEVYEKDSITPIEAEVSLGNETQTAPAGLVTFENVVYDGIRDYTVTADEHVTIEENLHVTKDTTLKVYMDSTEYELKVFTMDERGEPVFGADVILGGELKMTGIGGHVTFKRPKGNYSYKAKKSGHGIKEGTINLEKDSTVEFILKPLHEVSLQVVTDSASGPVTGAAIVMGNDTLHTNADGKADTSLVADAHPVKIMASGYQPLLDTLEVTGTHSQEFRLQARHYALHFLVEDSATNEVLENAMIMITQDTLYTDSEGKASVDLASGIYSYQVKATDYRTATGEVEVSGLTEKTVVLTPIETGMQALEMGLRMYPNPASDYLIIEHQVSGDLRFELLDITGKRLDIGHLQKKRRLDISAYKAGIYLMRFKKGDHYVNYKLIIKKGK